MDAFDIANAFSAKEQILLGQLRQSDANTHPGARGDNAEGEWTTTLRSFLPSRYSVGRAFAISVDGLRSQQLDLVIYDRHFSPLLFEMGEHLHIPAESIYAVFEVKPELNKEYLEEAGAKVASVRGLRRTVGRYRYAAGEGQNELFRIMGGILTRRPGWSPPFGRPFTEAIAAQTGDEVVDLGCVAEAGSFNRADDGALSVQTQQPLMSFLVSLMTRLQDLGPPPALDWAEWGEAGGVALG